jgi:hypothetical protein
MQDFFAHYGQGYRASPLMDYAPGAASAGGQIGGLPGAVAGAVLAMYPYGHAGASFYNDYLPSWTGGWLGDNTAPRPDNTSDFARAFQAAWQRTSEWTGLWYQCCKKCKDGSWKAQDNRDPVACSTPPPGNNYGNTAPAGARR